MAVGGRKMNSAEVFLWKTRIGVVAIDEDSEYCVFKYDDKFLNSNIQVSPIMMPLSRDIYQFKTLNINTFRGYLDCLLIRYLIAMEMRLSMHD